MDGAIYECKYWMKAQAGIYSYSLYQIKKYEIYKIRDRTYEKHQIIQKLTGEK